MELEFSTSINGVQYHIRGYHTHLLPEEKVNQQAHKHYFMEFHCVFAGEVTVDLPEKDQHFRVLPGQILLLPRELYHGVRTPERTTVERLCFNLSIESQPGSTDTVVQLCQSIREPMLFEDPGANALLQQCRKLRQQCSGALMHRRQGLLLLTAALQLLSNLTVDTGREGSISRSVRQKWIIEQYIESNFTKDTGLEGLAAELYISSRQARKLVQRFMGEDYKTIIIRRRMELAEICLRDPEKSLEEIAWLVGYRSYSGFQLSFKRHFGVTPNQRRKQLRTNL